MDIEAEQDLLSGPKQEKGISKLANRVIVEGAGDETIVKINDKPTILDIHPDSS